MPHVIGILGSPLPEGNTAILLQRALEGAASAGCSIETARVTEMTFSACEEIFYCKENSTCWNKDDLTPYYQKFRELDGVILASPVMTMGVPGRLKCFIDRFQVFFMAKYVRKEPFIKKEMRHRRRSPHNPDIRDGYTAPLRRAPGDGLGLLRYLRPHPCGRDPCPGNGPDPGHPYPE